MKTVKALVLRDFRDAGTECNFTKDDTPTLDAGIFANYQAAGLVSEAPAEKPGKPAAA